MRATLELVAERGFHDASMAMIAARAGIAAASIYRFFESKDHLIVQTYCDLELGIFQVVTKGMPEGGAIRERFLHAAKKLLGYCISSPIELKFLEQFRISPYCFALHGRMGGRNGKSDFVGLLFSGGEDRLVKELPPTVLFSLGFGPLFVLARLHHAGEIQIDEPLSAEVVERGWSAISP